MNSTHTYTQYDITGEMIPQGVDNFLRENIGGHYLLVTALLIVLVVVVVYLLYKGKSENLANPTQLLKMQAVSFGGSEAAVSGPAQAQAVDRNTSVFAQTVSDSGATGIDFNQTDAQILASSDFNCANRTMAGSDAWSWMNNVAHQPADATQSEGMTAKRNDNQLTMIMNGH